MSVLCVECGRRLSTHENLNFVSLFTIALPQALFHMPVDETPQHLQSTCSQEYEFLALELSYRP
jgi:hypothetical protein